jgi:molecular chaperone GrpE
MDPGSGERMERGGRSSSAGGGTGPNASEPAEQVERLRTALEQASRQAEEYHDLLRRARLDLAEQRRKLERERAEIAAQARVDLILRILAVLDKRASLPAPGAEDSSAAAQPDPTAQVIRELLEAEGVEKIEAVGALFNPWEHQALQHQTSPELDDQRVLAVLRDGYRLGDRVIRPAQVVVARRAR